MTKIENNRPGKSSTKELKKLVNFTQSIMTKNKWASGVALVDYGSS